MPKEGREMFGVDLWDVHTIGHHFYPGNMRCPSGAFQTGFPGALGFLRVSHSEQGTITSPGEPGQLYLYLFYILGL